MGNAPVSEKKETKVLLSKSSFSLFSKSLFSNFFRTQVVSFSKTFRLPGLDLHPNLQSKPITASGRRLRIYHPPPFAPPVGAGSRGADIPMNTVLDDHGTGGNIISLSLSAEAQGASDLAKGDSEIIASSMPSPSNSADKQSLACSSWHMNESGLRIDFDTTVVRKNYYTNREAFRQVLLSFTHSHFLIGVFTLFSFLWTTPVAQTHSS